MGADSRGMLWLVYVLANYDCTDFKKKYVKCHCGHAPTLHIDLSPSQQHFMNVSSRSPIDIRYHIQKLWVTVQYLLRVSQMVSSKPNSHVMYSHTLFHNVAN